MSVESDATTALGEFVSVSGRPGESYRPAVLIPDHNHKDAIVAMLDRLETQRMSCLIIDDGSEPETMRVLEAQAEGRSWVHLIRRPTQGGKGEAIMTGLRFLHAHGFTHALQMDADGQHAVEDVPLFIRESRSFPDALVLGTPRFGPDVPKMRLAGRQISRWLIWVETLSFDIDDPLFGFRVYPLTTTVKLLDHHQLGGRMDFDPEIAIRLKWSGTPVRNIPTRVSYPAGGLSNFRMFADNLLMVWLHVRIFASILRRLLFQSSRSKQ
jgi:glycosyltransferase involved in cell wall biosynthesis